MLNKKFKKWSMLGASVLTVASPVAAVISCSTSHGDVAVQEQNIHQILHEVDVQTSGNPQITNDAVKGFQPLYGQTINVEHGESYAEKAGGTRDANKWYANPLSAKDWNAYNGKYTYWYAAEHGWTVEAFQEFQKWVYNTRYKNITSVFGFSPWSLFYQTFVRARMSGPNDITKDLPEEGGSNPAASRWINALNYMDNDIDNTIPWYAFRVDTNADKFFTFNDHNLINGFERLKSIGNIVPVSATEAKAEANANGEQRTHYLVNGKFMTREEFVTFSGTHALYKVSETGKWGPNDKNFVRDDNGWIAYVALTEDTATLAGSGAHAKAVKNTTDLEQRTKVVEDEIKALFYYDPSSQLEANPEDRDYTNMPVINPTNKTYNDAKPNKWTNGTKSYKGHGKEVVYPTGYNVNTEFSKTNSVADEAHIHYSGADQYGAASSYYWQGKYTLVTAAPSWSTLLRDKVTVFPHEANNLSFMKGNGENFSRFGRPNLGYSNFYKGEHGSWEMWAWVEDGKGGHKIYKAPNYEKMMDAFRKVSGDPSQNVFWGNSNWIAPTKAIFKADTAGYKKFWYN